MGKSKKDKAIQLIAGALTATGTNEMGSEILAAAIVDAIEIMTAKPKKGEKSEGSKVWDSYVEAYVARYQHEPIRNAKNNALAAQLVARLGLELAQEVAMFYVSQTDAFYLRNHHAFAFCVKDAETLYARLKSGGMVSRRAADKLESAGATLTASNSYLRRKYGTDKPNEN